LLFSPLGCADATTTTINVRVWEKAAAVTVWIAFRVTSASQVWHSSVIVERLSNRQVKTRTGNIYRLIGPIDEEGTAEQGSLFLILTPCFIAIH
jgi:hypothetical protein